MSDTDTLAPLAYLQRHCPALHPDATGSRHQEWRHWQLLQDEDGVAWLLLDRRDTVINSLDEAVLTSLDQALSQLERELPDALVLGSAKASGFCAGADISMFRGLDEAEQAAAQLRSAHAVVDRLQALRCKSIALIHGPCLGGGLELALACDYRIAVRGSRLGFPEVNLGLHPGLGGTARSTSVMGPQSAMQLMLTGRSLSADRARKAGLVDAVTEARHAGAAVAACRRGDVQGRRPALYQRLLHLAPARSVLARVLRRATAQKVSPEHYPAPFQLIDLWRRHGGDPAAMRVAEIRSFASLVTSDNGQNMVRVFFLREGLKAQAGKPASGGIRHVHVIGAGAMGGDIAGWCALQGLKASLSDRDPQAIGVAIRRAVELASKKRLSGIDRRSFLDRLVADPAGDGIGAADLVIEAVPEDLELKQSVYGEATAAMKDGALLASNTSSIPLEKLRDSLPAPERFLGLHFFNPVARMQLVEVVCHDRVSDDARRQALTFVSDIDRLPVAVRSIPGFLVNRVLTPYLLEAMVMLDEGIPAGTVDNAATRFGMPVGPVELADRIGLDICLDVAGMLEDAFDHPLPEVPDWVRSKVQSGELGRKSGNGLYPWDKGEPDREKSDPASPEMTDRLVLPLLNTCIECLRRGVNDDEDIIDGAMILGTGFAPFTGGPLHYARSRGAEELCRRLGDLADHYGPRFTPDPGWIDFRASTGPARD